MTPPGIESRKKWLHMTPPWPIRVNGIRRKLVVLKKMSKIGDQEMLVHLVRA